MHHPRPRSLRQPRLLLLPLALAAALPAWAQQDGNTTPAATMAVAQAATSTPVDLDAVIVTGEKADRSVQDTATSVAVTTEVRMEQENLTSLYEVFDRTANVSKTYGDSGFTLRGMLNNDGEGAPLSTIYLDGAAMSHFMTATAPTTLWDLSQVEILRGPQSTIQGENALAGAVVLRTQDPDLDGWHGRARLQVSDPSDRRFAFASGGPLVEDELGVRIAVEDRKFDGFIDNPTRGEAEDALESTLMRAKALWTPSAIPGLTARLGFTHFDRVGPYAWSYTSLEVEDYFDNRRNFSDARNFDDTVTDTATLEVDYDLGEDWSLHAVSAWSDAESDRGYDNDFSPDPGSFGNAQLDTESFSQELRLAFDGERLRGLVGLYYANRDTSNATQSITNVDTPGETIAAVLMGSGFDPDTASFIAGLYVQALPVIQVDYRSTGPSESENKALFGDFEFDFNDRFTLLGGFRYDRQGYGFGSDTTAEFVGTLPDIMLFGPDLAPVIFGINQAVLGFVADANGSTPYTTRTFDTFLPKLGLRYTVNDDVSLNFVAQQGYRSGGSSFNIARSLVVPYDPEYTDNFELSLRSQWFDDALTINANAYYIDWKDKQVSANFGNGSFDFHTVNAGRAHLYGFELETTHRVSNAFDWYLSLGHNRTRFDDFETVLGADISDYSGTEFAYAPHWTAAIGGNVRFGEHWVANLNANHRSSVYTDTGDFRRQESGRTLVNARFGYESMYWSAWLFAENLFDEQYVTYRYTDPGLGFTNGILGAPRVVGAGLEARW